MQTTLCTLYNSFYLDKGLVLYDSLKKCAKDFVLYVLCMDDKCYNVLSDIHAREMIPIKLKEIENEKMVEARSNRSVAEYCWTCSSRIIQYVFEKYHPESCTYIDADMCFYHDPQVLVDEMIYYGKSVMMVPHRFSDRNVEEAKIVGTFCVEFNTFLNNDAGNAVLNHWHDKCLECCSNIGDGVHWGDQKYMDEWPTLFPDYVHVCENLGAGIAPWNIDHYKGHNIVNNTIIYKDTGVSLPIIFYHFQSLVYKSRFLIYTGIPSQLDGIDYNMIDSLYKGYLYEIDKRKQWLKEMYDLSIYIKSHPSISKSLIQKIIFLIPKVYNKIVGLFKKPVYSYSINIEECCVNNME